MPPKLLGEGSGFGLGEGRCGENTRGGDTSERGGGGAGIYKAGLGFGNLFGLGAGEGSSVALLFWRSEPGCCWLCLLFLCFGRRRAFNTEKHFQSTRKNTHTGPLFASTRILDPPKSLKPNRHTRI
jgi:hypothetical protein